MRRFERRFEPANLHTFWDLRKACGTLLSSTLLNSYISVWGWRVESGERRVSTLCAIPTVLHMFHSLYGWSDAPLGSPLSTRLTALSLRKYPQAHRQARPRAVDDGGHVVWAGRGLAAGECTMPLITSDCCATRSLNIKNGPDHLGLWRDQEGDDPAEDFALWRVVSPTRAALPAATITPLLRPCWWFSSSLQL